jgi:hypothetical protein
MKTITFFTTITGVADAFPVIKSSEFRPNWVSAAKESYLRKQEESQGNSFVHAYRCPGIFDLMSSGYIVTMPWDLMIDTYGDGQKCKWTLPSGDLQHLMTSPFVTAHGPDGVAENIPHRPGSLKTIIKFNTPWYVIAPKGVKFLVLPISYPDTYEFESYPGILEPGYSNEINFQVRWNVLNGKHIIKAGTPMCQLIPLTDEKFNLEVRDANDHDRKWIAKKDYLFNLGFVFKRGLAKRLYEKFFNR